MRQIARFIDRVISNHGNEDVYASVKADVKTFCNAFALYPTL
jgi:glycine/serine hydroxymethyltransferase